MKITLNNEEQAINVVKRMVFLAYEACGQPLGMGFLQEMRLGGIPATEDQIWQCAYNAEDYPIGRFNQDSDNEIYCDYVFGRMMKWGCKWTNNVIEIRDQDFQPDYQSFCRRYPGNLSLAMAAIDSLNIQNYSID